MKNKNIIISALIMSLLFSCLPCNYNTIASSQESETVIHTPPDGSVVYDTPPRIEFSVSSGCKFGVYLDGEEKTAGYEDGLYYIESDENLAVGMHTVDVVCKDDCGSGDVKSSFRFVRTTQSGFVSESFDGGQAGKMQFNSKLKVGTNASGEDVYLVPGLYKGKDGDENGAVGIYRDGSVSDITVNNRTSTYIYLYVPSYPLTGRVILEYDIRVDGGCECGIETKNIQNGFGTIGSSKLFGADGYIKDTDFEYKKGEWMHVRHIVDVPNGVEDMWIDGEQVYDKRLHTSSAPDNRITIIRFQAFATGTTEPYGFSVDNVYLGQQNVYGGFSDLRYKDKNGEYVLAEDGVVKNSNTELKLTIDISNYSINQTTIPKLYCGNREMEIESAVLEDSTNLVIKPKKPLPEQAKLSVVCTVPYKDGYIDVKKDFEVYDVDDNPDTGCRILSPSFGEVLGYGDRMEAVLSVADSMKFADLYIDGKLQTPIVPGTEDTEIYTVPFGCVGFGSHILHLEAVGQDGTTYSHTVTFETEHYGTQMMADFDKNISPGEHPRILMTADDVDYILQKAKTDGNMSYAVANAAAAAENLYKSNYKFISDCPDSQKQSQATQFQQYIETLAFGYLMSGDEKYAQRGVEYMEHFALWDNLAITVSNLITGHYAMAMAIGYDAFYDYMQSSESGRQSAALIKDAVLRMPYADTIKSYNGELGKRWTGIRDNFSGVIGGGMMALVLAFADEDDMRDESEYLMGCLIKSNEIAASMYYPDGGFFEGLGYSEYLLNNLTIAIEALFICCNTDYNLGSYQGFADMADFFTYMQTDRQGMNFHDSAEELTSSFFPYWAAYRYGKTTPLVKALVNGSGTPLRRAFYTSKARDAMGEIDTSGVCPDKYFYSAECGSFRRSFYEKDSTFCGFHAGRTGLTHDMLDLGEFMFESDGIMWAIDLGGDDYSLPSYFGKNGYRIYRKRPEGENCLVINPKIDSDTYHGQKIGARSYLTAYESKEGGAMAVYDLTDAYERDVNSYSRGYYFGDNRNTYTIQDEVNLKAASELYWFMHTRADIEIVDNKTAVLTQDGKSLKVQVYCDAPEYELCAMEAKPLETSPVVEGQAENTGVTKLTVHIPEADGSVNISVKLIPQNDDYTPTDLIFEPINEWEVPEDLQDIEAVLSDVYISPERDFFASVQVPLKSRCAYISINGKVYDELKSLPVGVSRTPIVRIDDNVSADVEIALNVTSENGEKIQCTKILNIPQFKKTQIFSNSLKNYDGKTVYQANNWYFYQYGNGLSDGTGYTITSDGKKEITLGYRNNLPEKAIKDTVICVSCDVKMSDFTGIVNFEFLNDSKLWYGNGIRVMDHGSFVSGEAYEEERWYNLKVYIDTVSNILYYYIDGKCVYTSVSELVDSFMCAKLQYVSVQSGAGISYRNFCINRFDADVSLPKLSLEVSNKTLHSRAEFPQSFAMYDEEIRFITVFYDESEKIISLIHNQNTVTQTDTFTSSTAIPDGAAFVRTFVWGFNMKPLAISRYQI